MIALIRILLLLLLLYIFQAASSTCSLQKAVLELPPGAKSLYTRYMEGKLQPPSEMDTDSPVFASIATFPNGVWVIGGVSKSGKKEYNSIFMWAFRPDGSQYPGYPIDVSDMEDFDVNSMSFELEGCSYELRVVEKASSLDLE